MILISKSYLQILFFYIFTFRKRNQICYVLYEEKPNYIFYKFINILNYCSKNKCQIKSINFFRNKFKYVNNQESMAKVNDVFSNYFKTYKRLGGQIYIENYLRITLWKFVVFDQMSDYYFNKSLSENSCNNLKHIYLYLRELRFIEKRIAIRFLVLKASISYFYYFLKLIVGTTNKKSKKKIRSNTLLLEENSSILVHGFYDNHHEIVQEKFINSVIESFSKDFSIKEIILENKFHNLFLNDTSKKLIKKELLNMVYISFKLLINFTFSKIFLSKAAVLIDEFIETIFKNTFIPDNFKFFLIDPIPLKFIPYLSYIKNSGYKIYLITFSIGSYYTKSFSNYNGPYSHILSSHEGTKELAIKSGFRGKIIDIKCYLTSTNKEWIKKSNLNNSLERIPKFIIPDNADDWFREISSYELSIFSEILNKLNSHYKFKVFIKKKKNNSNLEKYLTSKYPSNNIKFHSPERGFMGDFKDKDFILSQGISSLAIKSSELFKIPYLIYDESEKSEIAWQTIYSKAKIKPIFVRNINEIIDIYKKNYLS